MGLFDKVKSNLDSTLEKGKEISKDFSEKKEAHNAKQREKREAKEQAKKEKIDAKLRKRIEEEDKKIKNPKLNVNNRIGTVIVNDDRLIIGSMGNSYDILYGDIKNLNLKGRVIEIKTTTDVFKITPHLGYHVAIPPLYNEIRKKRTENKQPTIINNNSSSADELEKIMDMYQKGLLTDDEFAAMKKKIIEQ